MNVYSYLISLLKTVMSRDTGRYVYLRSKVMFTVCKGQQPAISVIQNLLKPMVKY